MHIFNQSRWMFDPADEALTALDPRWHPRRRLAAAIRRTNLLMLTRDLDDATLEAAERTLAALQASFEDQPPLAGRNAHSAQMGLGGPANRLALEMSPVIGRSVGSSLPMVLSLSDGHISARVDPQWIHEGPPGWMHGGIIAALFDEFLGLSQGELGPDPGKTGTLTVRYQAPTPLDGSLHFAVESARQEGRKRIIVGTLTAGGVETARAEAIFVVPR